MTLKDIVDWSCETKVDNDELNDDQAFLAHAKVVRAVVKRLHDKDGMLILVEEHLDDPNQNVYMTHPDWEPSYGVILRKI